MRDNKHTSFAMMLEKYMIPYDEWDTCGAPLSLIGPAKREVSNGYPTGIAKHPKLGWFGLATGQVPSVWWYNMKQEEFDQLVEDHRYYE